MKGTTLCITTLLVALLGLPALSLMTTDVIKGRYTPTSSTPVIDKDLAEFGNSPGRVYGTSVFFSDIGVTESLYFAGDTKAFSAFLVKYAKLKYVSVTLTVMAPSPDRPPVLKVEKPGSGCDRIPLETQEIHYDWAFSHYLPMSSKGKAGPEAVYLTVWPGNVQRDKIIVPANVTVKKGDR